jgi:AbrB family looped-hinge helix DNA binding protein
MANDKDTGGNKGMPDNGGGDNGCCCCRVESLISIDERGQMVLPKEIRERANLKAGDKLALVSWEKDGGICCLALIKADELGGMVKNFLGPMLGDWSK